MALIGNRSVLHKSPGRFLSGTVASIERSNFTKAGMLRNRFEQFDKKSGGIPAGCLAPASWSLPKSAGGMSSRNFATGAGVLSGLAAMGINIVGSSAGESLAEALGELIASAIGSTSGEGAASASAFAALLATGSAAGEGGASAVIDALGWIIANADGAAVATMTSYAVGNMIGEITPFTELSPQGLADAVWSKAIEAGYTADQVLRIIAAFAAGNGVDLEGASPQFIGLDGSTVRIEGEYFGGTRTITALDGE